MTRKTVNQEPVNQEPVNQEPVNRTLATRRCVSRTVQLVLGASLVLGACTTGTDSDLADGDAATIGSAPVGSEVDTGSVEGSDTGIGSEVIGARSGSIDESEPDLAMAMDREFSETPADEPTVETNPAPDDQSLIEVPQAELGGDESVLCASVQMGLDAVRDGASEMIEQHRSRLLGGVSSIADGELAVILESIDGESMTEDLLSGALERCEKLGYES